MIALPILESLPDGYTVWKSERGALALADEFAEVLRAAQLGPESGPETTESDLVGRRPLREIVAADAVFVVRSYIHGGLARWMTGERFADAERPFQELLTSHALGEIGIATPRIVAARARRAPGFGWYLDLISRRVTGLKSLTRLIGAAQSGDLPMSELKRVAVSVGELVRKFHDHGFLHADLTTENVLVEAASLESSELRFCTLDLDQSEFVTDLSEERRRQNLQRFFRCLLRRTTHTARVPVVGLCARFMRGYEKSREARRADWSALSNSMARSRAPHAIGWFVERVLGESRATAEKGISSSPVKGERAHAPD